MGSDENTQNVFPNSMVELAVNMAILVVARMIGTHRLKPENIKNQEQLSAVLSTLGLNNDDAFEVHIARAPIRIDSIRTCVEAGDQESAVVLLFTLIEGEINTALQILLRIRGFSHSSVSSALQGTDLKCKLDLVFPLIGIDPGPRIRQLAFEAQSIRNAEVHYKARPNVWTDSGNREGDYQSIKKKAAAFMARNHPESLRAELEGFVENCVSQCDEVQAAYELLHRFKT